MKKGKAILLGLLILSFVISITYDAVIRSRNYREFFIDKEYSFVIIEHGFESRGIWVQTQDSIFRPYNGIHLRGCAYNGDSVVKKKGVDGYYIYYKKNGDNHYSHYHFVDFDNPIFRP